jgi:hypothetical protein
MEFDAQLYERLSIEEYKALRAESLRCAGIISNTVWLGITQFAVTIGAWEIVIKDNIEFRLPLFSLLMLESLAATCMYLSELFKYVRVGYYISENIEKHFFMTANDKHIIHQPLFWENSIKTKRAYLIYWASLFILQMPFAILGCFGILALIVNFISWQSMQLTFLWILANLDEITFFWVLWFLFIFIIDILFIYWIRISIKKIKQPG